MATIPTLTVDGPTTRDRDDGIWLDPDGSLTVTVTAVGHKVRKGGDWDLDALARGESVYRPTYTKYMLPRRFSEDFGSLNAGEVRDVLAVRIDLSKGLESPLSTVGPASAEIRSSLTYEAFSEIVRGGATHPEAQMLGKMAELARELLQSRRATGALNYYDITRGWRLSEEGAVVALEREERNIAYIVIQEFMVLANRTVAEYLLTQDIGGLFRNHVVHSAAPPRGVLQTELDALIGMGDSGAALENLRRRFSLLMGRARYSPAVQGHYGLSLPYYAHVTSPLRRYADLVNLRALWAFFRGEDPPYDAAGLQEIATHLNALADARREAAAAFHLAEANQRASAQLDTAEEANTLAKRETTPFYRILHRASERTELGGLLRDAVRQRIESGDFTVREAASALFDAPATAEWREVRCAVLGWAAADITRSSMILNTATQAAVVPAYAVSVRQCGGGFEARAEMSAPQSGSGPAQWTPWYRSPTKKRAEQYASTAVLYHFAGEPMPDPDRAAPKSGPEVSAPTTAEPESGQHTNALIQYAQRLMVRKPRFAFTKTGPEHAPQFECVATLRCGERVYEGAATAGNKADARNQASKSVIDFLAREGGSDAPPPGASPS